MEIKKVTIIGVGAVGAVIASKLTSYLGKENVECLADGERKVRYERDGIFLNGEKQDFNFVESKNAHESDLIIIATKNLQLSQAIEMMKTACGKKTLILSVLNGLQSERDIAKVYGEENLLYGFVISLNSIHEGNKVECSDFGTVVFGEQNNAKTERTGALCELFEKSGMRFKNPDDIHLEMWKKFLINTVFNTLSAITRSPYGGFKHEVMQNLARKVGKEVVAVANAEGIALSEKVTEDAIAMMCHHDPYGKTSMLQDMEAGRKSENEFFCGTIVRLAERHNISTPCCEFLRDLIDGSEKIR
ncbi:MAG: ketopantoate reductase family protein [Treponema sp.]|nr:ketopantoate reductase family protein [Treponema sp.]